MKKKLRMIGFIMLAAAIIFLTVFYILWTSALPDPSVMWNPHILRAMYIVYPIITALIFAASFFVKGEKDAKKTKPMIWMRNCI